MIAMNILHFLPVQVLSVLLVDHDHIEVLQVDLECVETMAFVSAVARSHTNRCGVSSSRWTQIRKDWIVSLLDDGRLKMMFCLVSTIVAACCFVTLGRMCCSTKL